MTHPPHNDGQNSDLFIASSKGKRLTRDELTHWGRWLNATPFMARPLPKQRSGFIVDTTGLRLSVPDFKDQHWHPGMAIRRIKQGSDALVKIMNITDNTHVIDCTFGMGHDTLVMLDAGAQVTALERQPALLVYGFLGIEQLRPTIARRLHGICEDYRTWLRSAPDGSADHVYLDPMFPASGTERKSNTWAMFRRLLGPDARVTSDIINEALRVTRKKVILKLAPADPPPCFEGLGEAEMLGSRRLRFACWTKGSTSA